MARDGGLGSTKVPVRAGDFPFAATGGGVNSTGVAYTPKFEKLLGERRDTLRAQITAFSGAAPVVLEIGCGHGHFLTAYAAAHPDRTCVGIDLIAERIARATKKRDRARLPNLHFLQTEARLFLETIPEDLRFSAVFILFPDPWPKLRHNKHRILQPRFLSALAAAAESDCPLFFRTDFRPYFDAAVETVSADPVWKLSDEAWPFECTTVFQQRAETHHSFAARCKKPVSGP